MGPAGSEDSSGCPWARGERSGLPRGRATSRRDTGDTASSVGDGSEPACLSFPINQWGIEPELEGKALSLLR